MYTECRFYKRTPVNGFGVAIGEAQYFVKVDDGYLHYDDSTNNCLTDKYDGLTYFESEDQAIQALKDFLNNVSLFETITVNYLSIQELK